MTVDAAMELGEVATAAGNADWCSHYDNQCGDCSKSWHSSNCTSHVPKGLCVLIRDNLLFHSVSQEVETA